MLLLLLLLCSNFILFLTSALYIVTVGVPVVPMTLAFIYLNKLRLHDCVCIFSIFFFQFLSHTSSGLYNYYVHYYL